VIGNAGEDLNGSHDLAQHQLGGNNFAPVTELVFGDAVAVQPVLIASTAEANTIAMQLA
jgi:hypothetical protein